LEEGAVSGALTWPSPTIALALQLSVKLLPTAAKCGNFGYVFRNQGNRMGKSMDPRDPLSNGLEPGLHLLLHPIGLPNRDNNDTLSLG
jgi:hypothetical protein